MANSNRDDMSEGSAFYDNIEHVFSKICEDGPEPSVVSENALVPVEPISPPPPLEPIPEAGSSAQAVEPPIDIVQSLWRFKWSLVTTFVLVSAALIWLIWSKTTLQYQAKGEIRISPIIPRLVFNTDENGAIPFYTSFVNTQVSVIRSLSILGAVLENPDVRNTRWYQNPEKTLIQRLRGQPISPYERLRDSLVVQPRNSTELIDLSLTCPVPQDAMIIVNAILEQYIANVGDRANTVKGELYRKLLAQFETLQAKTHGQEAKISELLLALGTENAPALVASRQLRLEAMKARLDDLRDRQEILRWTLDRQAPLVQGGIVYDGNDVPAGSVTAVETQPKYHEDAEWVRLDGIVMTLRHNLDITPYGPRHHALRKMKDALAFQEVAKLRREKQLDAQWRDKMRALLTAASLAGGALDAADAASAASAADAAGGVGAVGAVDLDLLLLSPEDRIGLLQNQEALLQADYAQEKDEFNKLLEAVQVVTKETAALAITRKLGDVVRQRLDEKKMERDVPGSIGILMRAIAPTEPFQDRRIAFSCISLILGLGLGGSAALIRGQQNQTIFTPKYLPVTMRDSFLGKIPRVPTKKLRGKALGQELERNPSLIEPIRVMRTILLSRLGSQAHRAVLISSATPGTGKSSFTMMMGRSLAQAGRKVLLIDTDSHSKTLSQCFELADQAGFIEFVRDKEIDRSLIVETETDGLSILPAGRVEEGQVALEQIANGALRRCLGQLSGDSGFDLILLDCPAILSIATTIIMASQVHGTIMVERERLSHRGNVSKALARLASSGGRLLGTVLVESRRNEGSGYGSG